MQLSDEESDVEQRETQIPGQDLATCVSVLEDAEADHPKSSKSKMFFRIGKEIAYAPLRKKNKVVARAGGC